LSVRLVREAAQKLNRHIAIFQDLQGPKIRLGQLDGDFLDVAPGETLVLTTDDLGRRRPRRRQEDRHRSSQPA
jgi:pyruvate kinase